MALIKLVFGIQGCTVKLEQGFERLPPDFAPRSTTQGSLRKGFGRRRAQGFVDGEERRDAVDGEEQIYAVDGDGGEDAEVAEQLVDLKWWSTTVRTCLWVGGFQEVLSEGLG